MSEKDKLNIMALLDAIEKIAKYSAGYKMPMNFMKMREILMPR